MPDQNAALNKSVPLPPDQTQRTAAINPIKSFIVQAPAGSGKTTLLVTRYLNLLATVNEPEEVLAITFTRKAAQEMRVRVMAELNKAVTEQARAAIERGLARNWNLLASPQRMRIQTIDSFQQGLVQQLPYQSQLSLDYETIENADSLYEEAVHNALERIAASQANFSEEIAAMVAAFDNDAYRVARLLVDMLAKRDQWLQFLPTVAGISLQNKEATNALKLLISARNKFVEKRIKTFIETLSHKNELWDTLKYLVQYSKELSKNPGKYLDMKDPSDWDHLVSLFLTGQNRWRKKIDKNLGFPADYSDDEKILWFIASKTLQTCVTPEQLGKLRGLPPSELSTSTRQDLTNYALTLLACVQELRKIFDERRVVDFTERSIAARRALRVDDAPTQLALALDYRIRHILVDEYQDTSISQNEFLNLLMEGWQPDDGNTFFAVGDPMQSIYTFRAADLTNFLTADTGGIRHRHVEKLQLTANFRSSAHLVNWYNETFAPILGTTNDAELGQVAFAKSEEMNRTTNESTHGLVILESNDRAAEAELVAQKVIELHEKNPEASIAVLVRKRIGINTFFDAFRDYGINYRAVDMEPLSDLGAVQDIYSLTCALIDPYNELAWGAFLMCPLVGLPITAIEALKTSERAMDMALGQPPEQLSSESVTMLNRIREPLLEAMCDQHRSLRSRVERLWYQLGGANSYADHLDPNRLVTTKDNVQHFLDILESISTDHLNEDMLKERLEASRATQSDSRAIVEVMTIHSAKGLEFDHVILPACDQKTDTEKRVPLYARNTKDGPLLAVQNELRLDPMHSMLYKDAAERAKNEISRLLYVGATRAKSTLWVYGTIKDESKGPPKRSFLDLIYRNRPPSEEDIKTIEEVPESELTINRIWKRIDPHFHFQPQAVLPGFDANILSENRSDRDTPYLITDALSVPLAIGQLVHSELQRMVEIESTTLPNSDRVEMWRNELRSFGFNSTQIAEMLETVQEQLERTITSDIGRWLLDPHHEQSAVEVAYTAATPLGGTRTSIIDRTFISKGTRWIVDYKTSKIPDDRPIPLEQKVLDHQAQLVRYVDILKQQEDVPTKAAIFFTDVGELINVDISQAARDILSQLEDCGRAWHEDPSFKRLDLIAD